MANKIELTSYPFRKLRLPAGESAVWEASNPTFHRMGHYGILLTDRALYLYSPFWLPFARWRRLLLKDIRNIEFRDSILWPCLRVHLRHGQRALRTPWDHREEMDYDRKMLIGTVAQVLARLPPKAEHAASIADPRDDAS